MSERQVACSPPASAHAQITCPWCNGALIVGIAVGVPVLSISIAGEVVPEAPPANAIPPPPPPPPPAPPAPPGEATEGEAFPPPPSAPPGKANEADALGAVKEEEQDWDKDAPPPDEDDASGLDEGAEDAPPPPPPAPLAKPRPTRKHQPVPRTPLTGQRSSAESWRTHSTGSSGSTMTWPPLQDLAAPPPAPPPSLDDDDDRAAETPDKENASSDEGPYPKRNKK